MSAKTKAEKEAEAAAKAAAEAGAEDAVAEQEQEAESEIFEALDDESIDFAKVVYARTLEAALANGVAPRVGSDDDAITYASAFVKKIRARTGGKRKK